MTARAITARRRRVSYPVASLRVQASELESAVAQVLAKPRKTAVHRLRTATRKVEAHLAIVEKLGLQEPGFRAVKPNAKRVRKLLDRVRRAAGLVRDLDVQAGLARKSAGPDAAPKLRAEVKQLRTHVKTKREAAAKKLDEVLRGSGQKLGPMLEELIHALEPVQAVGLTAIEQEVLTRDWYADQVSRARLERNPELVLHGIRKAAKLARYMAESGLASRVVQEFAMVQEAAGRWHDCLSLRDAASHLLGKKSLLAALMKEQEAAARSSYEAMVRD